MEIVNNTDVNLCVNNITIYPGETHQYTPHVFDTINIMSDMGSCVITHEYDSVDVKTFGYLDVVKIPKYDPKDNSIVIYPALTKTQSTSDNIEIRNKVKPDEMISQDDLPVVGIWHYSDVPDNYGEELIVSVRDDRGDNPYEYTTIAWKCNGTWISNNEILIDEVYAWMIPPKHAPYKSRTAKSGKLDIGG